MAEYNQVDLQIGTEAQLADKVKDLPVGTLVGLTDPIHKSELDTTLQNEITSAGGEVVDLGTATSGTLTAKQLAILQASDNNLIKHEGWVYRKTKFKDSAGDTYYEAVFREGRSLRNSLIYVESSGYWQNVDSAVYTVSRPEALPLEQSLVIVHPTGGGMYLNLSEIPQTTTENTFASTNHFETITAYELDINSPGFIHISGADESGNKVETVYTATGISGMDFPQKRGTIALTSDIEKMYQHNIEFSTERGIFHYSFYSSKSNAYTLADLPNTERIPLCYEAGVTSEGYTDYAVLCGSFGRTTDGALLLECSGVYYDVTNAEFKHINEHDLEINDITDIVK